MHDIYDTYRESGISAAWQRFSGFTGINMRSQGEDAARQPPLDEAVAMSERFFGHGLLPITFYQPDFSALQGAPARVAVGGGTTSKGQFAQRTAVALAERLGSPLIDFPGGPYRFRQRRQGVRRRPPRYHGIACRDGRPVDESRLHSQPDRRAHLPDIAFWDDSSGSPSRAGHASAEPPDLRSPRL
jgi:hypothetical protein